MKEKGKTLDKIDKSPIVTDESEERIIIQKRLMETDGSYETIEEHNSESLAEETEVESNDHISEEIEERESETYNSNN
jgi:hypothetical protein